MQFAARKILRASNDLIIQGDRTHEHSPLLVLSVHCENGGKSQH